LTTAGAFAFHRGRWPAPFPEKNPVQREGNVGFALGGKNGVDSEAKRGGENVRRATDEVSEGKKSLPPEGGKNGRNSRPCLKVGERDLDNPLRDLSSDPRTSGEPLTKKKKKVDLGLPHRRRARGFEHLASNDRVPEQERARPPTG